MSAGAAPGERRRLRRADRFGRILERLALDGTVAVADLAAELGVSEATVRRDLQSLDEQKLLERSHGGAVMQNAGYELPVRYRGGRARVEKQRIAAVARERVADREVVALTGGTTTTAVAAELARHRECSVVTNALNIAAELAVRPQIRLVVTGGVARSASYELVGPLAEATLERINVDLAIVGVDGIDATAGLTTSDETEAATNRALIERSTRVIVVADAAKLGRITFAQICPLARVDELITDAGADAAQLARLRAAGLAVTVV